jgi:galactose-1-phosphate uridylyltransferase
MEFRKEVEKSKILIGGNVEESVVEIRYDPLTLQTSRIVRKTFPIQQGTFEEEIESSRGWCPFCDERIEDVAVRDPEIMKGELWKRGEAVLFSNLVPYSRYSLVVRVTEAHYLNPSEFRPEHFVDAFTLLQEYIKNLPDGKFYITIGMNFLKPAGSSIMHPHIQAVFSETSTDYFARMDWSALEFKEDNGKDFWRALVDEEKEGERYIGRTEKTEWLAAFAPKGFFHFTGVPEEREFAGMSEEQLRGIAEGITKILKYYERKGMNSFNFSLFCADRLGEHFRTNFHIVARTPFGKYYWCDVFFPKMLHDESVVFFVPEDYARELKEFWSEL